ncbi:MAG TPA: 50S ribosomal protein L15 [Phycisphaerales bacterium]|nr:50S ribosomal protein L15 [Phycisphaerales bacterium]
MMIHDITTLAGKYKARKRVGRGTGSGTGRRSGRGQKGASSRSGYAAKLAFEGGQMPYFRRLRKFGFSNFNFTTRYWIVNLRSILQHPAFAKGGEVSMATLQKAGLVRDDSRDLKILGDLAKDEKVGVKLAITANRVSAKVKTLVTGSGGTVKETGTRRDKVRGIDRSSDDLTPKNLTKKLKRSSGPKKVVIEDLDADAKDAKDGKDAKKGAKPAKEAPEKGAAPKAPAKEAPKAE